MTPTTLPLQRAELLQFLPVDFYKEARQEATWPIGASNLTESVIGGPSKSEVISSGTVSTKPMKIRLSSPTQQSAERREQARALEIHGWLDNLYLLYENYRDRNPGGSAVSRTYKRDITPVRSASETSIEPPVKRARGAPKKVVPNRLKPYLTNVMFPCEALQRLPMFDDIVTGAVKDSGGNTRPLSKKMMVSLLQGLDQIAAKAVQAETGLSLRHSQRIAMCLRIIERTAFKVAERHWYLPDWSYRD